MASDSPKSQEPIACTLDADKLQDRIAEWRMVGERVVSKDVIEPGLLRVRYSGGAETHGLLSRLVEEEAACCAFLRFDLKLEGDQTQMDLRYPPEAEPLIDFVTGARATRVTSSL
jgi:hypothetical protein